MTLPLSGTIRNYIYSSTVSKNKSIKQFVYTGITISIVSNINNVVSPYIHTHSMHKVHM